MLSVGNDPLRFVPQPQRGYVLKLPGKAGGIRALSDASPLDVEGAEPIRGLDRHGTYTVENAGPATENERTLVRLRNQGHVRYAAPLFSSRGRTVAIIPEIVVRVTPDMEVEQLRNLCERAGCTIKKRMEFTTQEYLLDVMGPDADAVFAAAEQLNYVAGVEWAVPNGAIRPRRCGQVFPNDKYFPRQWYLHSTGRSGELPDADINAPEAWTITVGDPNIIIAVIDCGVDTNHPDLVNNLVPGYDFYDDDDSPDPASDYPDNVHGTACAGVIAAQGNNAVGVVGVASNCKIMPIRVTRTLSEGEEDWVTYADLATAIRWPAAHGADVLNNSWGETDDLPILSSAILDVTTPGGIGREGRGCVVLFAAGNDDDALLGPATYPEVIAVGATTDQDERADFSSYGPELDVMAAGFDIWTTDLSGPPGINWSGPMMDYQNLIPGTSMACPIAAGVAALILSVEPDLTNEEVRHFLTRSARDLGDPGRDDYYGWGRVDARAALDMVLAKRTDLNDDWTVDLVDLVILIEAWGTDDPLADVAPATKRDGIVDEQDLALLLQYWHAEIPEPGTVAHWKPDETQGTTAHDGGGVDDLEVDRDAQATPAG